MRILSLDREIVQIALLKAQRHNQYTYNNTILEVYIEEVMKVFSKARSLLVESVSLSLVSEDTTITGNRYSFPDQKYYEDDCKYLFIANLYRVREG